MNMNQGRHKWHVERVNIVYSIAQRENILKKLSFVVEFCIISFSVGK